MPERTLPHGFSGYGEPFADRMGSGQMGESLAPFEDTESGTRSDEGVVHPMCQNRLFEFKNTFCCYQTFINNSTR